MTKTMTGKMHDIITSNRRVTVAAPHRDKILHGVKHGEFNNGRGKWVSVKIDGCKTLDWFWHEFVHSEII